MCINSNELLSQAELIEYLKEVDLRFAMSDETGVAKIDGQILLEVGRSIGLPRGDYGLWVETANV